MENNCPGNRRRRRRSVGSPKKMINFIPLTSSCFFLIIIISGSVLISSSSASNQSSRFTAATIHRSHLLKKGEAIKANSRRKPERRDDHKSSSENRPKFPSIRHVRLPLFPDLLASTPVPSDPHREEDDEEEKHSKLKRYVHNSQSTFKEIKPKYSNNNNNPSIVHKQLPLPMKYAASDPRNPFKQDTINRLQELNRLGFNQNHHNLSSSHNNKPSTTTIYTKDPSSIGHILSAISGNNQGSTIIIDKGDESKNHIFKDQYEKYPIKPFPVHPYYHLFPTIKPNTPVPTLKHHVIPITPAPITRRPYKYSFFPRPTTRPRPSIHHLDNERPSHSFSLDRPPPAPPEPVITFDSNGSTFTDALQSFSPPYHQVYRPTNWSPDPNVHHYIKGGSGGPNYWDQQVTSSSHVDTIYHQGKPNNIQHKYPGFQITPNGPTHHVISVTPIRLPAGSYNQQGSSINPIANQQYGLGQQQFVVPSSAINNNQQVSTYQQLAAYGGRPRPTYPLGGTNSIYNMFGMDGHRAMRLNFLKTLVFTLITMFIPPLTMAAAMNPV